MHVRARRTRRRYLFLHAARLRQNSVSVFFGPVGQTLLRIDVTLVSKRSMWQAELQGSLWYGGLRPRNLTMDASNTMSFASDPGAFSKSGAKMGSGISGDASLGTRPRTEEKGVKRMGAEVEGPEPPEFEYSADDIARKFPELGEDSDEGEGGSEGEEGEGGEEGEEGEEGEGGSEGEEGEEREEGEEEGEEVGGEGEGEGGV
jgi:hypothetical protein